MLLEPLESVLFGVFEDSLLGEEVQSASHLLLDLAHPGLNLVVWLHRRNEVILLALF